jgi:hypothetical protein
LETSGEVCFEEKVANMRDSGMSADEIAQQMGVDQSWVNSIISMLPDGDSSAADASSEEAKA